MRPDKVTLLNGHSCATAIPKLDYDGGIQGLVLDSDLKPVSNAGVKLRFVSVEVVNGYLPITTD
jgi:hypothetical protein